MQDKFTSNSALSQSGQIVLVLQGGGALGSYQAGVYQALHEAGLEPIDYYFGFSDLWVQAVVVGQKPLPQTQSHSEGFFQSHGFPSHGSVAVH